MEGQKQLNPNCFSFHRPPEKREGMQAGKFCEFYTPCPPLRFEPWTILIVATGWYLGVWCMLELRGKLGLLCYKMG